MHAIVHSADIQDRDGGALLMASLFGVRIPTKPATHSNRKPAIDSDLKPAGVPI